MAIFNRKKEEEKEKKEKDQPASFSLPESGDAGSYQLVESPHLTEKGVGFSQLNKYSFKVSGRANKLEIKKAVEKLYKVKVKKVNMLNAPSKFRRLGRQSGRRAGYKKAIVTLNRGYKIDLIV